MNTVAIESHYRNRFAEKEIQTSHNKFDCLNIDKDFNGNDLSNNKTLDQVSRSHQKLSPKRPQDDVNNYPENQKTFSNYLLFQSKINTVKH